MSSRTDDVRGSFTWSTLTTNRRRLRGNHPGAWASLRHSPRLASTRDAWILTLYARDPPTLRTARAIRTSLSSRVRVQRVDAMHSSWQLPPPESLMWPRASQRQIWPGIPRPPTIVAPVSRPSPERPPSAAAARPTYSGGPPKLFDGPPTSVAPDFAGQTPDGTISLQEPAPEGKKEKWYRRKKNKAAGPSSRTVSRAKGKGSGDPGKATASW
ncbi:hypothetical protein Purlil1_6750 [Purpureocillium lilacinum]|uniref:Uncharacterized protein n=1 Tax=Purpureocillium lilacinum TaxID=33203 RepID=A0ABR0BXZ6_PURLI|nr:hypothetical protein Purlil1_6750 [Purpureocillium lilacinum]